MLRNSTGLSLLRGRLGVQLVVDNHTIDDILAAHGWDGHNMGKGPSVYKGTQAVQEDGL